MKTTIRLLILLALFTSGCAPTIIRSSTQATTQGAAVTPPAQSPVSTHCLNSPRSFRLTISGSRGLHSSQEQEHTSFNKQARTDCPRVFLYQLRLGFRNFIGQFSSSFLQIFR
jgi:hypothetical protein